MPTVPLPAVIAVVILVGFVAFVSGGIDAENFMEKRAVEHGCASYDQQTGKWGWKP